MPGGSLGPGGAGPGAGGRADSPVSYRTPRGAAGSLLVPGAAATATGNAPVSRKEKWGRGCACAPRHGRAGSRPLGTAQGQPGAVPSPRGAHRDTISPRFSLRGGARALASRTFLSGSAHRYPKPAFSSQEGHTDTLNPRFPLKEGTRIPLIRVFLSGRAHRYP